jgi:transcriptional regulator with XRE-family HTH domain
MSRVDAHVGRAVAAHRAAMGFSRSALASRIGMSMQILSECEDGIRRISASKLFEISRALDVPVAYFFEGYT